LGIKNAAFARLFISCRSKFLTLQIYGENSIVQHYCGKNAYFQGVFGGGIADFPRKPTFSEIEKVPSRWGEGTQIIIKPPVSTLPDMPLVTTHCR
jgi:hypothetical protein